MDIEKFKQEIEAVIKGAKREVKTESVKDEWVCSLRSAEGVLEIKISPRWLGYDLTVNSSVLGRPIGHFVDTDNYSLGGANEKITLEIFKETKCCLEAFLEGEIYIGGDSSGLTLAIPLPDGNYTLKLFKPKKRWWQLDASTVRVVSSQELNDISGLKPLK